MQKIRVHTFAERVKGSLTTGAVSYPPSLRTDSVNRGFCISLLTSEMILRAISSRFFLLFFLIEINTGSAQNLFSSGS